MKLFILSIQTVSRNTLFILRKGVEELFKVSHDGQIPSVIWHSLRLHVVRSSWSMCMLHTQKTEGARALLRCAGYRGPWYWL